MHGSRWIEGPTADLSGRKNFPEPVAVVSLREGRTFHAVDEDGQPLLIITDGVTTVALDSGVSGLSYGVVVAASRLADSVRDFATSVTARWQARGGIPRGRHRRKNRRRIPPPRNSRRNAAR